MEGKKEIIVAAKVIDSMEKFFSVEKKYRSIEKIHMKIFENPSFKLVPFFDPFDVILKNTPDEETFLKDFESLSKFLKIV